jgi:hypothetical protein
MIRGYCRRADEKMKSAVGKVRSIDYRSEDRKEDGELRGDIGAIS